MPQKKPKKEKLQLFNINPESVDLVDVGANLERFILAKASDDEQGEDTDLEPITLTLRDGEQGVTIEPDEQTEEPMSTTGQATTQSPTEKPVEVTATSDTQPIMAAAPQAQRVTVLKMLGKRTERTLFYIAHQIESLNFPYGDEMGEEAPDEVMAIAKSIRDLLGDKVAKRLEREMQQDISKAKEEAGKATAALVEQVEAITVEKAGASLSKATRGKLSAVMTALEKAMADISAMIGGEDDTAKMGKKPMKKALETTPTADADLLAPFDLYCAGIGKAVTAMRTHLLDVAKAIDLTEDEREEMELEQAQETARRLQERRLVKQFEAMDEETFRAHLEACEPDHRALIVKMLAEHQKVEKKIVEQDGEYCVTSADGTQTLG